MTSSESSGGKAGRRPGPTIDLEATEVETQPITTPGATDAALGAAVGAGRASQFGSRGHGASPEQPHTASEANLRMDESKHQAERQASKAPGSYDWRATWSGMPSMSWPQSNAWRVLGAAAAGGLMVLAGFLIAGWDSRPDDGTRALDMRLVRVEQQMREFADRPPGPGIDARVIAGLTDRLTKIETAMAALRPSTADPALANRISIIEGDAKAVAETVGILSRRNDEIATIARDARGRGDANAVAIAELEKKIASLGTATVARNEFDAVASKLAALERGQKALEAELAKRPDGAPDRSGRLAIAAAALNSAVERGGPFVSELATVKALSHDSKPLALIEPFAASGMPTAASLGRELSELASALYQAVGASPREGGFLDRLQASAEKLIRIRPIADVPGNDPTTIILRIELKAAHNDIAGALSELAKLPPAARAPAEAWIKKAEARNTAVEASRGFAFDALAALGK